MTFLYQITLKERTRRDYDAKLRFVDLQQYPRNGRGRSENKDGSLPTLTTNSGSIYSQESFCNVGF